MRNFRTFVTLFAFAMCVGAGLGAAVAQEQYGFAVKRPIFAGACPTCVWGPFGEVVKKIMAKRGWDVQVCYNCNLRESPLYVANASMPPALRPNQVATHPVPPQGKVDFGVTTERAAAWSYQGIHEYVKDGPKRNLRLLAAFEDPNYLIVAVRKDTGITDLSQIREKKMPVRIHSGDAGNALLEPIFKHYGIMPKDLESWGGKFIGGREAKEGGVDILLNRSGANSNNAESSIWNWASHTMELEYLTLSQPLLDSMVRDLGYKRVMLPRGYLKGVRNPIPTLEYSGQVMIARADMPDQVAYELTKAVDEDRMEFLWGIRMFVADPRTMWKTTDVPLHPGAERYYREVGYMK